VVRRIDLAMLPDEALSIDADCYCVVDVLRATTTIATLFTHGLTRLWAVDDLERARAIAKEHNALLLGEVGGLPPEGFAGGNSPREAAEAPIAGREAVLFTTNGTGALCALAGRGTVLAGALSNASAVARRMANFERVAIVCAGEHAGRRFALEDFGAASVLVRRLLQLSPGADTGDAAGLAAETARYDDWLRVGLPQQTGPSGRLIAGAEHARALVELGLGADVRFAAQEDTSGAVPEVVDAGPGWALLTATAQQG
jgi:2-phosphosulfolactate phosphatase